MKKLARLTLTACLPLLAAHGMGQDLSAPDGAGPRNVILIIGDGMDEHQVTIARNYLRGAQGRLVLDTMPVRSAAQVLTTEDKLEGRPIYVADSANTATSLATGEITSRGRIATSAGSDKPITTLVQLARRAGLRTGIVATSSVTDATPASFVTHVNIRHCENPTQMEQAMYKDISLGSCAQHMRKNGGLGPISEQLAVSGVDVLLGGGYKHFTPMAEGRDIPVLQLARDEGYRVVQDTASLLEAPVDRPLLGLFAESTLPVRLRGENSRIAEEPEPSMLNHVHRFLGDVSLPEPMACEPNPAFAGIPTLKQMTDTALRHLSEGNERGFFLMIESASIDKQAHDRNPCGSIGEVAQLDEAVASALAFAEQHPRTLILVTADHSHAAQLIPYYSLFAKYPVPTYTPGYLAMIETPEGGMMAVNYASSNFIKEEHTGAAVPLYANSEGRDIVPSYVLQPELFHIMRDYLGL